VVIVEALILKVASPAAAVEPVEVSPPEETDPGLPKSTEDAERSEPPNLTSQ
jgi:hypothetical protein